jgi:REP element-mobilizing transposase RayT
MARPLRVVFHGAWYHVMNRGALRATVFHDRTDAQIFLRLLSELVQRFHVEIHAHCLMGNHYHLLLRTPQPNLSAAMRHLDGVFTQRVNRRHGADGPVFRGRFRSVLVQANRHLLCVSRYIHLNPVQAGLARRAEDWFASSYAAYLEPARQPAWLQTRALLGHFGTIGARHRYREFVEAGLDPGTRDFYGRARVGPVFGDEAVLERIRVEARAIQGEARHELPDLRVVEMRVPLASIAREVERVFAIDPGGLEVRRGPAGHGRLLARGAFVCAARRLGSWRLREIARWLGYASYTGAAQAAQGFQAAAVADPLRTQQLAAVLSTFGQPPAPGVGAAGSEQSEQMKT